MTFQIRALDLARAFQLETRADGSTFYLLPDTAPQWMRDAVYAAHHDELPNDWRYEMCRQLTYSLAEHESADYARDAGLDIASDATPIYPSDVLAWYADRSARLDYADQWINDTGLDSADGGICGHLFAGMTYCIEQMLHDLTDACEARERELVGA